MRTHSCAATQVFIAAAVFTLCVATASRADTASENEKTRPLSAKEQRDQEHRKPYRGDSTEARNAVAARDSILRYTSLPDSAFKPEWMLRTGKTFPDTLIARARVEFTTATDRFTGATTTRLAEDIPLLPNDGGVPDVSFNLVRSRDRSRGASPWLEISYRWEDWAFLDGTVLLLLDGKTRVTLLAAGRPPARPFRQVVDGGVYEWFFVPLPATTLAQLARARSIEVRLPGEHRSVEKWFPIEGLAAIRKLRASVSQARPVR